MFAPPPRWIEQTERERGAYSTAKKMGASGMGRLKLSGRDPRPTSGGGGNGFGFWIFGLIVGLIAFPAGLYGYRKWKDYKAGDGGGIRSRTTPMAYADHSNNSTFTAPMVVPSSTA